MLQTVLIIIYGCAAINIFYRETDLCLNIIIKIQSACDKKIHNNRLMVTNTGFMVIYLRLHRIMGFKIN